MPSNTINTTETNDILAQADLAWEVKKQTISDAYGVVEGFASIRRSDTGDALGVVTSGYVPVQNRELVDFIRPLVDMGDTNWGRGGHFRGGCVTFIQADTVTTDILPGDTINNYLMVANAHDGSMAWRAFSTSIRVVCQNTFNRALTSAKNGKSYTIKHTSDVSTRILALRDALSEARAQAALHATLLQDLTKRPMNDLQATEFFQEVFTLDEPEKPAQKKSLAKLNELFQAGKGQDIPGVRGTRWAAFNAVTEYLDHHVTTRLPADTPEARRSAMQSDRRLYNGVFGPAARTKTQALELLAV